jgi:hypothetical protein
MTQQTYPVGLFEIYVDDMDRARAFYHAVFRRDTLALPSADPQLQMYAFPWLEGGPGAAGALVQHPMMQPGTGSTLVYFSCEDVAEESALAAGNGGQVVRPKMSIGDYGYVAFVQDSEGNLIGLHSRR